MTEAVPIGELLHDLALPAPERWEYPEDAYSCLDFASPLRHISSSLGVARPFTN